MILIGIICLIVGVILLFFWRSNRSKLRNLRLASASTISSLQTIANQIAEEIGGGSLREYVKIRGVIECDRPLISQLKQEPCVYYSMTVTWEYNEEVIKQDNEGKTIREKERKSETVAQNSRSIPFTLQDSTGEIRVNPERAEIETVKVLEEFRPENFSGGSLTFGNFSINLPSFEERRQTIGYRYQEEILPIGRQILVIGTATDEEGMITIRKPTEKGQRYFISLKSEEELSQATNNAIRGTFYSMIFFLTLGLILLVAGVLRG
ncbi:conserved hypothetical protein [Gloeothece citriformis PCC 7424]|uniref:RING-type E3 ubiquitin transferase n=1 Tax=Gloeothece citriformis (strain PCC 7424) TaxID=65393 RepID=B7K7T5_GLOC7|nr:E3 ubiquitin ligase family protein [Gloeothece citriformis]ACK71131.1 conserved hypothetical protein [Gloeothece citriformis PCC 7424]